MDDQTPMPFGKYKGRKMEDVPASYLLWLRDDGVVGEVRAYIEENMTALQRECPDYISE
jgi:uncharacterized protein (DUF3820 family)